MINSKIKFQKINKKYTTDRILLKGTSESGKLTLINIMGSIDLNYSGLYLFENINVQHMKSKKLSLLRNLEFGYIFQEYELIKNLSVYENVRIPFMFNNNIPMKKHGEIVTNM